MKKIITTGLAALNMAMAFGQNYVSGPMGVYGQQYNAPTTINSTGSILVGAAGVWTFGGIVSSSPRSATNGVTFTGGGTYGASSATNFIDGYVSETGSAAFTYPVGDASAASGNQFHPMTISAPSSALATVTISYNAAVTPNKTRAQLVVDTIDAAAYYTMASTATTTATATASVRDGTGVFKTGATLFMGGYNSSLGTPVWQDLRGTGSMATAAQNLTTRSIDLSQFSLLTVAVANPLTVSPFALLQGPANTATPTNMSKGLHATIPLTQPYNVAPFGIAATGYAGSESIASVPTNMTDWIMVELRDPTTPTTIIAVRAALLMMDGTITDVDGVSAVSFPGQAAGNYYVAIRHRNHLGIRTSATLSLSGQSTISWDFRQLQGQAYQKSGVISNPAMKDLGNGYFAMYGGNTTGDVIARASGSGGVNDYAKIITLLGTSSAQQTGVYSNMDVNMDGNVRASGGGTVNDYSKIITILGLSSAQLNQHL